MFSPNLVPPMAAIASIFRQYSRSLLCVLLHLNYTFFWALIPSYVCMCRVVYVTKKNRKISSWCNSLPSYLPPTSYLWMQRTAANTYIIYLVSRLHFPEKNPFLKLLSCGPAAGFDWWMVHTFTELSISAYGCHGGNAQRLCMRLPAHHLLR